MTKILLYVYKGNVKKEIQVILKYDPLQLLSKYDKPL